jgi:hypothetical protein
MRAKALSRLIFIVAAISWLALLFTDLSVVFSTKISVQPDIPIWMPGILYNIYVLALFYYYKLKIDRDETLNFVDLLWRVFATGLIATVVSLLWRLLDYMLGATKLPSLPVYQEFGYLLNLTLFVGFFLASFTAWKRLILYQKSKWLMRLWSFFHYAFLATIV